MNEQAKITNGWPPGPWHWVKGRTLQHLHDKDNVHGNFARVSMPANHGEYEAVANLIAAAPLLYTEGARLTAAFRAIGVNQDLTQHEKLLRECEAAIVALDAALTAARGES